MFSYESECDGKRRYHRKADAKRDARRYERLIGRLYPYRCSWCDGFHLGHRPLPGARDWSDAS